LEDNQLMPLPFGVRLVGIEANLPLLRHLSGRYGHLNKYWAENPSCSPEDVGPAPALGTRPDLVNWLWKHIHSRIPLSRPWVVLGTAVLAHPDSEIVFAFAAGTRYALRLPAHTRKLAIAAGAKRKTGTGGSAMDLATIGDEWVFGTGPRDAEEWWDSAFEYSARNK
jgi:hypothetical protein